jgi:hypothetical protein
VARASLNLLDLPLPALNLTVRGLPRPSTPGRPRGTAPGRIGTVRPSSADYTALFFFCESFEASHQLILSWVAGVHDSNYEYRKNSYVYLRPLLICFRGVRRSIHSLLYNLTLLVQQNEPMIQ